ncbi:MAG: hypothetical protein GY950_09455 [bacterium]|nr:hypothetical protein [bacterium]
MKQIFLFLICMAIIFHIQSVSGLNAESVPEKASAGNKIAGPPITRSQMVLEGDKYARVHWTITAQNQTGISCGGNFKSKYPLGKRIGMAYKWGAWDDVSTFVKKIKAGYGAGTGGGEHVYDNFSSDCVTGISCTGFVSRAWHLKEKHNLNYPDHPEIKNQSFLISHDLVDVDFQKRQTQTLKKGDAFINKTHIIMFIYETRDGKVMIMDSVSKGVSFDKLSWSYMVKNEYKAIRYNNIKEIANPPGTTTNPIIINGNDLPFTRGGNTRDIVSMEFDRYPVSPGENEQGPEDIYQLRLDSPNAISITLNDLKHEGIDNDIFLLSSLKKEKEFTAADCIARGDHSLTHKLKAGTYYIIVDGGPDKPGEYTLKVNTVKAAL